MRVSPLVGLCGFRFGLLFVCGLASSRAADLSIASSPPPNNPELPPGLYAEFVTPRGTVVASLFHEKAPLTVTNFVGLAEGSLGPSPRKPFFDGLAFHRVVPDFVVQGGDPRGDGEGGPGYEFADELHRELRHDAVGVLSMANAGPDTNGSQFFFTLQPVARLDFLHSVFGQVVQGLEVLPLIRQDDTMQVKIRRVGPAAQAFWADRGRFDALISAARRFRQPYFDDPQSLLPTSPPRARTYQNKLSNLARFSDLSLYLRVFEKRDAMDLDAKPGAVAHRFAELFGVHDTGVVALYFADRDEWALWIADRFLARFNPQGLGVEDAKQAFLDGARKRAQVAVAAATLQTSPEKPLSDGQRLKLSIDEIMQGMIDQLLPIATPTAVAAPPR